MDCDIYIVGCAVGCMIAVVACVSTHWFLSKPHMIMYALDV